MIATKLIRFRHSVWLDSSRQDAWNFTQDWTQRHNWDPGVKSAVILSESTPPKVRFAAAGGSEFTIEYSAFDEPNHTSLKITNARPDWIGGGGSWTYVDQDGGTLWTQNNSLKISGSWRIRLFAWLMAWQLKRNTEVAMRNAESQLEKAQQR